MATVERYVNELHGYLRAISDLNDQVGFRHGYYAGYERRESDLVELISAKFGKRAAKNLLESNLRTEGKLISSYALRNAAGAEQMDAASRLPRMSETVQWRVQQYLSFEDYCDEDIEGRWVTRFRQRNFACEAIVIATAKHVVWVVFATRRDTLPADVGQ